MSVPKKPLANRLMLQIALASGLVILLLTGLVYVYVQHQLELQVREALAEVNRARAMSESEAFHDLESHVRLLRSELSQAVKPRAPTVPLPEKDGLQRLDTEALALPKSLFGLVLASKSTPWLTTWTEDAARVLGRIGPLLTEQEQTLYCIQMGKAVVSYVGRPGYAERLTTKDFEVNESFGELHESFQKELKTTGIYWSNIYQDGPSGKWMLTAAMPLRDGEQLCGYCAIDQSVDALLERVNNPALPGSFNVIINRDNELLLHPELRAKIEAAGGKLSLASLRDPLLNAIDSLSRSPKRAAVELTPDGQYLAAISTFEGPGWRFATLYPMSRVHDEAWMLARATLIAALLGLMFALISIGLIISRQVAKPLSVLVDATRRIAAGEASALKPAARDDEIGHLARAVLRMEQDLVERDKHLVDHTAALEREVAERRLREQALEEVSNKLHLASQAAVIGAWAYEFESGQLLLDKQVLHMYGYAADELELARAHWHERVHPDDWPDVNAMMRGVRQGAFDRGEQSFRIISPDGATRHIHCYAQVTFDAEHKPLRIAGVNVDVTEREQQQARIVYMATHDALTGLPNRSLLHDRIAQAIAAGQRLGHQVGVIFIDLDRFKTINDSLGHSRGDELLQQAGQRLDRLLRKMDTLGRLGGDEFLVVLPILKQQSDGELVAEKILALFEEPFKLADQILSITPSLGLAFYPSDGDTPEALIKNADTAMYRAKARGRNTWQAYSAEMSAEASDLLRIENDLRRALENNELRLHYQPKIRIPDKMLIGAEALVRWQRPEFGLVFPDKFIPVAEERGLMTLLSAWVMREACRQLSVWREAGFTLVPIAVNLDAAQFSRSTLPEEIKALLDEFGLAASLLHLELTESALLLDEVQVRDNLTQLRAMGLAVAVDDFGTGFSSLSYLRRFPLDTLKIDRSFIQGLGTDDGDSALVSAIIGIGHTLGLVVVAEGVETEAQLAFLGLEMCDEAQGYLFSKPVPPEKFIEFLGTA